MMPERNHEALRTGVATEWISDVDGVGRVRCLSFRDHRGPGGVFRMMPVRAVSSRAARSARAKCSRSRSSRTASCSSPVRV